MRENRSYGLTTLRRRHLKIDGSMLRFSFRGKSGVEHTIAIADPRLARIIQRCRDLPGQDLFQYLDAAGKRHLVSSDDVNDYLREISGRDVTAKDFRTWGGTMLAAVELRRLGEAVSRREADRNIIGAIDAVAERLGNTRAVCRKYYVHPALISAYLMGETIPQPPPVRRTRHHRGAALRRDEVLVLQFLQERL
jgi:DNA topoisomerase-1